MIGIDIIAIERFGKIARGDYANWSKFFTNGEWEYAFGKANPAQSLAGIYAAKEAVMKAAGGAVMGRADRIEIVHTQESKPMVRLDGQAQPNLHISISHTQDTAAAVAIQYER